jgi:hypothetical protein
LIVKSPSSSSSVEFNLHTYLPTYRPSHLKWIYCNLRSASSTLTGWRIIFFAKKNPFLSLIFVFMIYYDIVIWRVKFFRFIAYSNFNGISVPWDEVKCGPESSNAFPGGLYYMV